MCSKLPPYKVWHHQLFFTDFKYNILFSVEVTKTYGTNGYHPVEAQHFPDNI